MFSGKRVFEPFEALRVVGSIELAVTKLESQVWSVAALGPVSAGIVLGEVFATVLRLRRIQLSCLSALAHWLATESQLSQRLEAAVRASVIAVSTGVVGAVARVTLPAQIGDARIRKLWSTTATAATSLTTVLGRLKTTAAKQGAVRIEQSWSGGKRNFVIYLPGTQSWLPHRQSNPFNLSSDLRLYAGLPSSAESGVRQLLNERGVGNRAGDKLVFVAHSQGAMVAARLAGILPSGSVRGIITVGGPIAGISVNSSVSAVNITHTLDPVPRLALVAPVSNSRVLNLEVERPLATDQHPTI